MKMHQRNLMMIHYRQKIQQLLKNKLKKKPMQKHPNPKVIKSQLLNQQLQKVKKNNNKHW